MIEQLGHKRYAIPVVVFALIACVMILVIYPMIKATPKDLPLGLLSLDQTATTPQGELNLGGDIVTTIQAAAESAADEGETPAVEWKEYASQADLDAALENQDIYAAIAVPEDFTASRVAAQTAAAQAQGQVLAEQLPPLMANPGALAADPQTALAPIVQSLAGVEPAATQPLRIIINQGKNPMTSTAIESMIKDQVSGQGVEYEVEVFNPVEIGGGPLNLAQPFAVIPTFLLSLICSIALFFVTRPPAGASWSGLLKTAGLRAGYGVVLSGLIGFTVAGILAACGLEISVGATGLFLWLSSLALIWLFVGCFAIAPPLGALVILACFGCGLAAGNLAYEFLPGLYQDWFYPWAPQRFIGEGLRDIFYNGGGAFNSSAGGLLVVALIGLAALAAAALIPNRKAALAAPPAPRPAE